MSIQTEVIFFDATGTLFDVRGSVGEIYSRFAQRHGLEVDPAVVHQEFLHAFRNQPPLAFPPGILADQLQRVEYQWWWNLASEVFAGFDFPGFDEFFTDVYEFFRTGDAWRVFDDVVPTLETLKDRGLRMAVISNFDSRLDDLLRNLRLYRFFDAIHISTRIGVEKPDPAIFRAALSAHAIDPHQAFHVGDRLEEDVEGATSVGINAVLIDRDGKTKHPLRIQRLDQILGLIG